MSTKYYELTDETIETPCGRKLHRIRSLTSWKPYYGHQVSKGDLGGYIETIKNLPHEAAWVADSAWVYGNAVVTGWVEGNAKVFDRARVNHYGKVGGNAIVRENAVIGGTYPKQSEVFGNAEVFGSARVLDSIITDEARVFGHAKIWRGAKIFESSKVFDNAVVEGAMVYGNATVFGDSKVQLSAHVFGDASIFDCATVTGMNTRVFGNSVIHGHAYVCDNYLLSLEKTFGNIVVFRNSNYSPSPYTHFDLADVDISHPPPEPRSLWKKLFRQ